ncbi:E3 ubiquitin-protein ligase SP1-like [Arachis duranensis]|uniref:E3 ubiquitin-protein ligase SP1-like n=1 Tax=Arachis duranensis TaxID=130453 RepID=A0A6P4CH03_ARADU|nr:E3 ubiquitin-protein ligase SP1-like [Arachis duranensis]
MTMIPWGGISCCLSAAALYLLGRSSGRDAELFKSVTRVNQLKELAQLLDAEILPLVVSISGRVSSETLIHCEFSGLRGVIVEETAEQHFLKHNDARSWIQDSALMLSMSKEVHWYLDLLNVHSYLDWDVLTKSDARFLYIFSETVVFSAESGQSGL